MNTKWLGGAIILILIVIGGWFYFEKSEVSEDNPIKIGVVFGLTGTAATWSDYGKKAIDLAVEEINESGGVNGRMIKVVYEDSQTNPAVAASAFQKLAELDKVDVVVGDVWSFITNPMIPLAEQAEVVLISPTVMDKSVEQETPFFFSLGHTVASQESAVREFFDQNGDIKTASVLCWDDNWGNSHSALFKQVAEEKNVQIISEDCTADFTSNYRTEMAKIKEKDPDAILMTTSIPEIALKAFTELGMRQKVLTTSVIVDAIETRDMPRAYAKNVWFTDWVPNETFVTKFQDKYETFPILEAQNHYETVFAIAKAFTHNSTDLRGGLKNVKYEGVDGLIDFTVNSQTAVNKSVAKLYTANLDSGYVEVE